MFQAGLCAVYIFMISLHFVCLVCMQFMPTHCVNSTTCTPKTTCSALVLQSSSITTIQSWLKGPVLIDSWAVCHSKGFEWTAQLSITTPTVVMSVQSPVSVIWADTERDCTCPANTDSTSDTAVGLFLGGVVAAEVLLMVGIVCGACRLEQRHVSSIQSYRSFIYTYIDILLRETWKHVPAVLFAMKCVYRCRVNTTDSVIIIIYI